MTTPPMTAGALIEGFFDDASGTVSYVLADPTTGRAAIVDPVLGFDYRSGSTDTELADRIATWIEERRFDVDWILETHAHADHLSSAQHLKRRLGGQTGIGENICAVQEVFKRLYNLPDLATDGRQFDRLFADGETLHVGSLEVTAMWVPGHTPADLAYRVGGDAVFVGDTLFMPDAGTARADFPGGDAGTLYRSIRKLLSLPEATRLFVCHDYPPAGRAPGWQTTVAAQRSGNIHVRDGTTEAEFIAMREARDATLGMPALILPSIQVNIRAGNLPAAEDNGTAYLKIPLNGLKS